MSDTITMSKKRYAGAFGFEQGEHLLDYERITTMCRQIDHHFMTGQGSHDNFEGMDDDEKQEAHDAIASAISSLAQMLANDF